MEDHRHGHTLPSKVNNINIVHGCVTIKHNAVLESWIIRIYLEGKINYHYCALHHCWCQSQGREDFVGVKGQIC